MPLPKSTSGGITGGGDSSALWIYDPSAQRVLVYYLGQRNRLELRAVRNIEYDLQAIDFGMPQGRAPSVADVKKAVSKEKASGPNGGRRKK